ncbi:fungal-specific transcription factor domain-containing protein [Coniochaeta sp. 2T2.1]|nr:fungal-specific transcription factor domain-containing protein [Coniochaeta sp. 2T2.1]
MQPLKNRRARVPLSCDPCRARKLKCNREQPCQNCAARSEEASCKFRGPKNGASAPAGVPGSSSGERDATRQRIDHLEDLVKRLIAERQASSPRPSSNGSSTEPTPESVSHNADLTQLPPDGSKKGPDPAESGAGETVIDATHSVYHGGDDWYTVLREINELKKTYTQQDEQHDFSFRSAYTHTVDGSGFLSGQVKPIERIEILSTLPPKPEVDRLIAFFFDSKAFPMAVAPILHQPTFMREYDEHWRNPSHTHIIWLGLLFSMLGITMLAYHQYGEPPEYEGTSDTLFQLYRLRTAQCLQSGDISKCLPYTVETLRLNATAELNRKDDIRRGLWIMTGVIVRAAINMGYHRDPSHSPNISVLQAEYRRRIWLSVISMDDMASFVGGFPRMMLAIYSDTQEPRNLHDWELSEDMTSLPPSRPMQESTSTTYLLLKGRLFKALGRVGDFNITTGEPSYETILEVDRALHDAYEEFPPHMKLDAVVDKASLHLQVRANFANVSLLGMYHRGMCALHRRYLAKSRVDPKFKFSRDRCLSSALTTLGFQYGLETSWYKLTQTRHMLILAGMVIVLELELRRKAPDESDAPGSDVLLQALRQSCTCWAEATETCDEALRFHQFLVGMLKGFRDNGGAEAERSDQTVAPEVPLGVAGDVQFDLPGGALLFGPDVGSMDFDWSTWDAFIEEPDPYDNGPIY